MFENQISGILSLHNTPVIGGVEFLEHGTIVFGKTIQFTMKFLDIEFAGISIGAIKVSDIEKRIVVLFKCDVFSLECRS